MSESAIQSLFALLESGKRVPENILVHLGGAYLYFCHVADGSPSFSGGFVARIGLIFLIPLESDAKGVHVKLLALRLGSSLDGIHFEPDTKRWEGHGYLSVEDGQLEIEYLLIDSGIKMAEEKVWPDGPDGDWKGEFNAEDAKGEKVFGRVRHVYWPNAHKLSKEFEGKPIRFSELLDPASIGAWGRRLYAQLSAEDRAASETSDVLIDVVSGAHVRLSEGGRSAAVEKLRRENPFPVIYRAECHPPMRVSIGVGPIR